MPREPTFELYRDEADEWRWRLRASNGNVIADGGEGYASKQGAKRGIESVRKAAPEAPIDDQS
ncbi:MAG: HVO_2922 family protein [Halanaeroarchaeum sp.]